MARTHKCDSTEILPIIRRNIEGTCQKVQVGIEIHQESDRSSRARARTRNPSEHGCSDSNRGIKSAHQGKGRDPCDTTYDLQDEFQKKMYTDQTGRFPTKSSRGYTYIMVLVELDSDTILAALVLF